MSEIVATFSFDLEDKTKFFYELLKEEDFDFKTKDILVDVKDEKNLKIEIVCSSILDLKIASNALIKSLEIIEKTLNV